MIKHVTQEKSLILHNNSQIDNSKYDTQLRQYFLTIQENLKISHCFN
jgi:hypothetical protein